jgi:hypothetical protein
MPPRIQARMIKFAPDEKVEWVEEREWRIPDEDGDEGCSTNPLKVAGTARR